jgi:hypothetical protein
MNTAHDIIDALNNASDAPIPKGEPGSDWGSPKAYRVHQIIEQHGGVHWHIQGRLMGGFIFADGSHVWFDPVANAWEAHDAQWVRDQIENFTSMPDKTVMPNDIGLVAFRDSSDMYWPDGQYRLTKDLEAKKIPYTVVKETGVHVLGGEAYLVCCVHPKRGIPMTILCVPIVTMWEDEVEQYYFFANMTEREARRRDWRDLYKKALDYTAAINVPFRYVDAHQQWQRPRKVGSGRGA